MNEDDFEIPDGKFDDIRNQGKYFKAAIQSIVALNKKLSNTNEIIGSLGGSIVNAASIIKNSSEEIAKSNEEQTNKMVAYTKGLFAMAFVQVLIMCFNIYFMLKK